MLSSKLALKSTFYFDIRYLSGIYFDLSRWGHSKYSLKLHRRGSMTKDDLVTAVVKSCKGDDLSKRLVSDVIDATFDSIGKSIKKEKRFSYPAFGTFTVRNRKARKGRNPQTGEEIKIKASRTVGFKPAPTLKTSL